MASLNLFFSPIVTPQRRVIRTGATAAKSSGGGSEEKGILDFILGSLTKQEQIYETDPILKKVEGKTTGTTGNGRKGTVAVAPPPKKKDGGAFGGLGGLFAKKWQVENSLSIFVPKRRRSCLFFNFPFAVLINHFLKFSTVIWGLIQLHILI